MTASAQLARLSVSAEVLSGAGAGAALGDLLARRDMKAVAIVAGPHTRELDVYHAVCGGLQRAGLALVPIPARSGALAMMDDVETIAAALRESRVDAVVGIGGGSVLDLTKIGTIVAAEGSPAEQHAVTFVPPDTIAMPRLLEPKLPVVAVPTTFSGSEGNGGGLIRGGVQRYARSFRDDAVIPAVVVLDPLAGAGQRPQQAVSSALNAFANCVTALYVRQRSVFTDALASHGVRLLIDALEGLASDPAGAARLDAAWGAVFSGIVVRHAYAGLHHALTHALVSVTGLPHAIANALVIPHTITYHVEQMQGRDRERLIAALPPRWHAQLEAAAVATGLPRTLRAAGVARDRLPAVAEDATHERPVANDVLTVAKADLLALLERAY